MTREEIEQSYKIEHGIIRSPGMFEGEPVYVPYFWELLLEGSFDDEGGCGEVYFRITDEDRKSWPELNDVVEVAIWQEDSGFVYSSKVLRSEVER